MNKFIRLIFMVVALSACSPSLKPTDPAIPIEKSVGDQFQIVIEANPTTGYHWEIVDSSALTQVEFIGKEYKSTSEPGLTGGGGLDIFTFKIISAGETNITLGNYPPSNDPVDPVATVSFKVVGK